ncbi:MAG: ABC transporter substrate-binding protein [Clostridiales bacterium]|nr:ABC transporter substrate-binding protein [Clostridiales bacterium]
MKKIISLVLAAVLVAAMVAGCTKPEPTTNTTPAPTTTTPAPATETPAPAAEAPAAETPAPETTEPAPAAKPVELTVVTSYGGDDGNRVNYENAFKAYEAETGNTVLDASGTSNEEWKARIMADFETGAEPDVLFFFVGVDANKLIEGGKVVSVEEIRAKYPDYASNMKDETLPKSPADGKQYAIPVNGYWEGLFVNKKVLAAAGVEIPGPNTTWDQFMADCQKIADAGYIPIAASLNEVPHYWFEFTAFNHGNVAMHRNVPASSADANGAAWAAGLNDIKTMYEKGFFPPNTNTATDPETNVLMTDDSAAFMIDGSWKMGWFEENAEDISNFTVTYVPGMGERKSTDIIGGLSSGYYITRKAWDNPEKQAAAVAFVQAMTKDEVVNSFGATAITALKNGTTAPADASSLVQDALVMTKGASGVAEAAQDGLNPSARADLFGNVSNIVTGGMTAEAAIDQALAVTE